MPELKKFSRKEVAQHNTKNDAVFIIENQVYDVTRFLDDHPGGHEVLVNVAGKDASEGFDDVGHSPDAREMMNKYLIGEVVDEDRIESKTYAANGDSSSARDTSNDGFFSSWKFSVLLGLLMAIMYNYIFG